MSSLSAHVALKFFKAHIANRCERLTATYDIGVDRESDGKPGTPAISIKNFSGIAGGLPASGLKKGDVIIADSIYGYECGKLEKEFKPRGNWTYKTDSSLLNGAVAYSLQGNWRYNIKSKPPEEYTPKAISCEIASGEKVVDDPTNEFFAQVLKMWPKVKAVEMEGAAICSAIEQAQSLKIPVGFMVIRAISDLPRPNKEGDKTRGTEERDDWKAYASDASAAFTIGWIADGLPLPPSAR